MTPEERTNDILTRCWEKDPAKREQFPFHGLDAEITKAIHEAEQAAYEVCVKIATDHAKALERIDIREGAACRYVAGLIEARKEQS